MAPHDNRVSPHRTVAPAIGSFVEAKSALPYPPATQNYTNTEILKVDSVSTDTPDSRAKTVIGKLLVSGKDKTQGNDSNTKKSVGKGHTDYSTSDEIISAILSRFGLY